MVNLIFEIAHVFTFFETALYVFWGSFCIQRQGRDAGEERQGERGEWVCASAQSPILQPKAEIFVFEWIFFRQKAGERSGLTEEKETHIFFFSPEFLFPSVAKGTSLASEWEAVIEQTAHSLTERFIEYMHS